MADPFNTGLGLQLFEIVGLILFILSEIRFRSVAHNFILFCLIISQVYKIANEISYKNRK